MADERKLNKSPPINKEYYYYYYYCDAYLVYDNSDNEGTNLKVSFSARYRHQVLHGVRLRHTKTAFKESPKFSVWNS